MPGPNSNPQGGKSAYNAHRTAQGASEHGTNASKRLKLRIAGYEEASKTAPTQYHKPGSLSGRK
jgi:hypothetical protein